MSYVGQVSDVTVTGTITAINQTVQIPLSGHSSAACTLTGTWTGSIVFEASNDGPNWTNSWVTGENTNTSPFFGQPVPVTTVTANDTYKFFKITGITQLRIRASTAISGTVNATLTVVAAPSSHTYTSAAVIQNVAVDPANSSLSNLAGGATFTGTATSTLGVSAIEISLLADQNCTVNVDQSIDGLTWDFTDQFNYYTNKEFGIPVTSINSYYRVRVTNNNAVTATTTFRLQTCLCPIIDTVPRSLDVNGNFKVASQSSQDTYGFPGYNTPYGETRTIIPFRLVGSQFELSGNSGAPDPNFWTTSVDGNSGTGSIAQSASTLTLTSGTGASSFAKVWSVRRARYVGGNAMRFRANVELGDTGTNNNTKRWGVAYSTSTMPTLTDGAWFQSSNGVFSVALMKAGTQTTISSGSFNGSLGVTYTPTTSNTVYEIYWSNGEVYFVISGSLVHTFTASTTSWSQTMSPYIYIDNFNTSTQGAGLTLAIRVVTIHRLGPEESAPLYKHIAGVNSGTTLKYGPGRVRLVALNAIGAGTTVSLYDTTSSAGVTGINAIALMAPPGGANPLSTTYSVDFYNGLYVITAGTATDVTINYE